MQNLLKEIFNHDFTGVSKETFKDKFFSKTLTLKDLKKVHDFVASSTVSISGKNIPAVLEIGNKGTPFMLLTQIHGNEPPGLAAALMCMALQNAGLLNNKIWVVIGNPLAAKQYFSAWEKNPDKIQETRDVFRMGIDENGNPLKDLNRIPENFRTNSPTDNHTKRSQELDLIADNIFGILDIHSARGSLTCVTDHLNDSDLLYSPIRLVLTDLNVAIGSHTGTKTFKGVCENKKNIKSMTGIEAGRHEAKEAPEVAAKFALSILFNNKITEVEPFNKSQENGEFTFLKANKKLNFSDMEFKDKTDYANDLFYTVKEGKASSDKYIEKNADGKYSLTTKKSEKAIPVHLYDETEEVKAGRLVAISVPGGTKLYAKTTFRVLFVAKSGELYSDKNVVLLPVKGNELDQKFCYPCTEKTVTIK